MKTLQDEHSTIAVTEKEVQYFNENYDKSISIKQCAREHMMSVNWFIHGFKEKTKLSPKQYIVSLRLAAAKRYLESTDKSINEIANLVGYENALYFSRLFKKHIGMSPSEYKKKNERK